MWSGLAARLDYLDLPSSLRLPVWKEARAGHESRATRCLPPPEPTPHPRDIVLVPGFLDDGRGVRPLAARLEAAGHRPRLADIGRNIACAEVMAGRLAEALQQTVDDVGGPVVLIGHSRGGTLSRAVTVRHPDLVAGLITAGSPLADPHAIALLLKLIRLGLSTLSHLGVDGLVRNCGFGDCCVDLYRDVAAPFPDSIPFTSVLSLSDGLVAPHAPRDPHATIVELDTTHMGVVGSPDGFAAIMTALDAMPAPTSVTA
jgi:triacylglycerol lipase